MSWTGWLAGRLQGENYTMKHDKSTASVLATTEAKPSLAVPTIAVPSPKRKSNQKTGPSKKTVTPAKPTPAQRGSKKAKILALLRRPNGASLDQLLKATGWQAHSVRGFLSGELKKRMGLRVLSAKKDDVRTYRLTSQ